MCRWFVYISPSEPCLIEDMIVTPDHSLSKQVLKHYLPGIFDKDEIAANSMFNIDGLGLGWYTSARDKFDISDPRKPVEVSDDLQSTDPDIFKQFHFKKDFFPAVYKSLVHPLANPSFLSICANTTTTTLFGHIRASIPSPSTPIPVLSDYNCHPFVRGKYIFMHNGGVANFSAMRREVMNAMGADEAAWVKGDTDTEAFAGVFFTILGKETGKGSDAVNHTTTPQVLKKTMTKTVTAVLEIQQRVITDKSKLGTSNLNMAVTDGHVMFCMRFCNDTVKQPRSLYLSITAGAILDHRYELHPDGPNGRYHRPSPVARLPVSAHRPHVIVASEPMTYEPPDRPPTWVLIPKNDCILAEADGSYKREPFEILPKYFVGPIPEPGPAKPPQ